MTEIPVVMLMGPTASGKTGLSLQLAQQLPVEVISVDSAQVYRGMDIGTAKLDAAKRATVPHHLVDILDPAEPYSAARFCEDALRLIEQIRGRGRIPLLVGGTMLYFRSLQQGLSVLPSADPDARARIEAQAAEKGWPAMHAQLSQKDPVTAARLHPNDQQRIQRALEIVEMSGQTASFLQANSQRQGLAGRCIKLALSPPERSDLHARIEQRFHEMMQMGFLEEVKQLKSRCDLHANLPSIRSVGYRQIWEHLEGAYALPEAVQRGIAATRQFAKRQITWLRSEPELQWLDPASDQLLQRALKLLA